MRRRAKILVEGYTRRIESCWRASSTMALVKTSDKNMIVDPGCNRNKLLLALGRKGLKTKDVDFVLLTHGHTDHTLLSGMF